MKVIDYKILEIIKKSTDYSCPICKLYPEYDEEHFYFSYEVNGKEYPIYINENKGSTMDGSYHNWDEIHCCKKCKVEFWYKNGI